MVTGISCIPILIGSRSRLALASSVGCFWFVTNESKIEPRIERTINSEPILRDGPEFRRTVIADWPEPSRMPRIYCDRADLYYEDFGEGRPVVFLHGAWAGCRFFEEQLTGLSSKYRTVALDFRAHGRSGNTEIGHTRSHYAADVHELLDTLDLEDVIMVGWSLGAIVSWEYVDTFGTDRIRALVNVDMEASPMESPDYEYGSYNIEGLRELHRNIQTNPDQVIERSIDELLLDPSDRDLRTLMFDEMSRIRPSIKSAMLHELLCDYRAVLPAIDVPTLVCAGVDEKWRSVASVEATTDLIPDATFELFRNSGHCPTIEEPNRFNHVLADFVDSVV